MMRVNVWEEDITIEGLGEFPIDAVTPTEAAKIFNEVYDDGRSIFDVEDIEMIVKDGGLLRDDGTFDLMEFNAYIIRSLSHGI